MQILDAVTVADSFPASGQTNAAQLGPVFDSSGGYYNVATNPVYARYAYGKQGQYTWSKPVPIPVGPALLAPGTVGVMFANYTPGRAAVVSGALSEKTEPPVQITAGGIATPSTSTAGVTEAAYAEVQSNVVSTLVAEAAAVVMTDGVRSLQTAALTFDGLTAYLFRFFCYQGLTAGNLNDTLGVNLWIGSQDQGRMMFSVAGGAGGGSSVGQSTTLSGMFEKRFIPAATSAAVSARIWSSGHTGVVLAGPGGAGGSPPSFLQVLKLS